jgi:hypothetical protein
VVKTTVTQRSFLLGEMREEFLEADDLETRQQSLRGGLNCRITAARTIAARLGTRHRRTVGAAYDLTSVQPGPGLEFGLLVNDSSLEIISSDGALVQTITPVPWSSGADVWVEPFREIAVVGGAWGLKTLTYNAGIWTFADYAFASTTDNAIAQPYWSFYKDVRIQPSATSGSVTVTASQGIWSTAYVGLRVRYGRREILLTGYVSPTVMNGTVASKLPPSYRITLASAANFAIGDAVIGQDTNFQGLVLAVSGPTIDVATTEFFDGPDISEKLSSPRGSSTVSAKSTIAPLSSPIWDEPLISPVRGYPRAGASAAGRLALVNFSAVPDLVCLSSVRGTDDFEVGAEDDDAIVRQCGDNTPQFRHAVNGGDLLLFSDRGIYIINIRDGSLLTPSTFNAILIDKRGANEVRPVAVDDAVVFVESSGESIAIAQLSGNVYLKWAVRSISTWHSHLVKTPVKLCGPSLNSSLPEKYMFVVNEDGTMAVLSWFADFNAEAVGFLPWATDGEFRSISPIFGGYWALVDRGIGAGTARFLEEFDEAALLDCILPITSDAVLEVNGIAMVANGGPVDIVASQQLPLAGASVRVVAGDWDIGTRDVGVDGLIVGSEAFPDGAEAGFNFVARAQPWPVDIIQSPHLGMIKVRTVRFSVSVLHTGPIAMRSNTSTKRVGGYHFGDDLSIPPPRRTQLYRAMVLGRRDHPEIEIIKEGPGAFQILAINQEVSG